MRKARTTKQSCSSTQIALIFALSLFLSVHLNFHPIKLALAQQNVNTNPAEIQLAGPANQLAAQARIGLAPHDRPACQLPPMTIQRRPNQAAAANNNADSDSMGSFLNGSSLSGGGGGHLTSSALLGGGLQAGASPSNTQAEQAALANGRPKFDSSERLRLLRGLLAQNNYDAYLVTPNDEHGSEYVADFDRRLRFISGFTGSNGYALILLDRAVLFTDGRYALQADQDLDCNWWLVVGDNPLADIHLWLKANAAQGIKISAAARLMSMQSFDLLADEIGQLNSKFELTPLDLVDQVREKVFAFDPSASPSVPAEPLFVHPLQFNGNISWQEKVVRLVDSMAKLRARHYVISQLDEIAWLLNLRGNDIPQSPLFKAYLIVSATPRTGLATTASASTVAANNVPLDQQQQQQSVLRAGRPGALAANGVEQQQQQQSSSSIQLSLFVDMRKIDKQVWDHLRIDNVSLVQEQKQQQHQQQQHQQHQQSASADPLLLLQSTSGDQPSQATPIVRIQVDLEDYESFTRELGDRLRPGSPKQIQGRLLLNAGANVAIHALAKDYEDRLVLVESLVNKLKAVKSSGEVQGMRQAHWRDSLAIAMLLAQLELDISSKRLTDKWTEVSAARELEFYRSLMDFNRGQSFDTISAYGSNAAIVHYKPNSEAPEREHRLIGNQSTYLLDCGGQYLDGTTDITRTVHFGEPTDFQRETYTRVLMGAIDMMSLIFEQPKRSPYRINDMLARRHLLELGLDYAHGTGHGIGLFSLVHEAPPLIEHYSNFALQRRQQQPPPPPFVVVGGGGGASVESSPILLQPNMFSSVEPGYYKANDFGIRLENIVVTQRVSPRSPSLSSSSLPGLLRGSNEARAASAAAAIQQQQQQQQQSRQFLRFEPISLVPFEPKLIKMELLSNKQKAWLNSYNLMVRLRMTQQINHYLAKIRGSHSAPAGSQAGAFRAAGSSVSQLGQQLINNSNSSSSGKIITNARLASEQLGLNNYMRLEPNRLQEKLELAHKWIMSKTELIPLDVAQSRLAGSKLRAAAANRQQQQTASIGGRKRVNPANEPAAAEPALSGQRLMLAYMSSMPFNDAEAGQAMASLNQEQELLARADNGSSLSSSSAAAGNEAADEANKCFGFECDIWLVSALNSHPSRTPPPGARQQLSSGGGGGVSSDGWPTETTSVGLPSGSKLDGNELTSTLMDLFSIRDSSASDGGISMGSLWSIGILSLIVVLQIGIIALMCSSSSSSGGSSSDGGRSRSNANSGGGDLFFRGGPTGRRRNWCPNGRPASFAASSSPSLRVAPTPVAAAAAAAMAQETMA